MKTGVYANIPMQDYHRMPGISKSDLDLIHQRPPRGYQHDKTQPRKETDAMRLGTAVHMAVLEPGRFATEYLCPPECDRRTKAGKALWEDFCQSANGKTVIDRATYDQAMAMADAVRLHPSGEYLLREGEPELSIFAEKDGLLRKCRLDWLGANGQIVDLKTTCDASPDGFSKAYGNYRYHVQAAWYLDTCEMAELITPKPVFVFLVVESIPPYLVATYVPDPQDVEFGRQAYLKDLETLERCLRRDEWPGYSERIEVVRLPRWLR